MFSLSLCQIFPEVPAHPLPFPSPYPHTTVTRLVSTQIKPALEFSLATKTNKSLGCAGTTFVLETRVETERRQPATGT